MTSWLGAASTLLQHTPAIVRITVAQVRGSTPREAGATMLVTLDRQHGTIGGGQLEWQATEQARSMLRDGDSPAVVLADLRLGPDLAQCCGGDTCLWLERIDAAQVHELARLQQLAMDSGQLQIRTRFAAGAVQRDEFTHAGAAARCTLQRHTDDIALTESWTAPARQLWIFGAGHVGAAVVRLLQHLPLFDVRWIDSRATLLDAAPAPHIRTQQAPEPVDLVAQAQPGTYFLVLTHDHELDFQLCAAVLARRDAAWLGLIGSRSKSARFRGRLRRAGMADSRIAGLTCPVGTAAIRSKLPAAIAVGIVAQLLTLATQENPAHGVPQGCDGDCRDCGTAGRTGGRTAGVAP